MDKWTEVEKKNLEFITAKEEKVKALNQEAWKKINLEPLDFWPLRN